VRTGGGNRPTFAMPTVDPPALHFLLRRWNPCEVLGSPQPGASFYGGRPSRRERQPCFTFAERTESDAPQPTLRRPYYLAGAGCARGSDSIPAPRKIRGCAERRGAERPVTLCTKVEGAQAISRHGVPAPRRSARGVCRLAPRVPGDRQTIYRRSGSETNATEHGAPTGTGRRAPWMRGRRIRIHAAWAAARGLRTRHAATAPTGPGVPGANPGARSIASPMPPLPPSPRSSALERALDRDEVTRNTIYA
jgi:hypothetical protein